MFQAEKIIDFLDVSFTTQQPVNQKTTLQKARVYVIFIYCVVP
jgi:hypothetical protein